MEIGMFGLQHETFRPCWRAVSDHGRSVIPDIPVEILCIKCRLTILSAKEEYQLFPFDNLMAALVGYCLSLSWLVGGLGALFGHLHTFHLLPSAVSGTESLRAIR